jgi:hypothetical protein
MIGVLWPYHRKSHSSCCYWRWRNAGWSTNSEAVATQPRQARCLCKYISCAPSYMLLKDGRNIWCLLPNDQGIVLAITQKIFYNSRKNWSNKGSREAVTTQPRPAPCLQVIYYVLPNDGVNLVCISPKDRGSSGHCIGNSTILKRTGQIMAPEAGTTQPRPTPFPCTFISWLRHTSKGWWKGFMSLAHWSV